MISIDEKTYFALKKNVEQFCPESFEAIKDLVSKDSRTLSSILLLLGTLSKPNSLLQYQPLINLLLQDEKLISEVFRIVFAKDNLNFENIIIFTCIIQSEVYRRILELNDKSDVYESIKIAFGVCKDDDTRILVIDGETLPMLSVIKSFPETFKPLKEDQMYVVIANSRQDYFNAFKDSPEIDERKLYDLWIRSFVCRDSLYTLAMGILYNEYESLKLISSEEGGNKPFTYYADYTTRLLRDFYDSFKDKKKYEKLDEIASFCLLYFNLEQEAYSKKYLIAANEDIYHILIEFMMISPEVNLDIIVNQHKKNRYQDAWKFTIPYDGTELSGSGFSQFGNVFTLHDLPIVERVLAPFFKRLYEEDCEKPHEVNRFVKILENKIFVDLPTSPSNPIYLKRAVIPSLLLGLLATAPEKKAIYKQWLISVIGKTEGLPRSTEVLFSHLVGLSDFIDKFPENYDQVFDLILEDAKLYGKGLPTNVFAVQTILTLIKRNFAKARQLFIKLLDNPEYFKRDEWDYHTFANLGDCNQYDSTFILLVVKSFTNNKDWLLTGKGWNINEVVPYLVELYLKGRAEAQEVNKVIITLTNAENKTEQTDNLCTNFLRSLAERDPEKAYSILIEILGDRKPWNVFLSHRDSLVSIAEHLIAKAVSTGGVAAKDLLDKANRTIEKFIDDPDPSDEKNGRGYNYHTNILNNEDSAVITTVRGHVCWAVQKLCVHDYSLEKAWQYTDKLLKDKNLYVVQQALVPFIEVVKRRSKLTEKDRVAVGKAIEYCVDNYGQYKALANHMGLVCSYFRDIDEQLAAKFIDRLSNSDNYGFFIVYFAYFREDQYPEKGYFDSRKFKSQIISLIKGNKDLEAIKKIFNQISRVIDENIDFLPQVVDSIMAYDNNDSSVNLVLHSVYRIVSQVLVKDKNRKHYQLILDIYKRYLKMEGEYIEASLKAKEINKFIIDYAHKDILEALYDISKEDYYACTAKVMELALTHDLYFDHYSISKTIASEHDPKLIPKAINLLNKLTSLNPKYYEFKNQLESLLS